MKTPMPSGKNTCSLGGVKYTDKSFLADFHVLILFSAFKDIRHYSLIVVMSQFPGCSLSPENNNLMLSFIEKNIRSLVGCENPASLITNKQHNTLPSYIIF